MSLIRRVTLYVRPYWQLGLGAVLLVSLSSFLGLLTPWPLKILIDSVISDRPLPSVFEDWFGSLRELPYALLTVTILAGFILTLVQRGLDLLNAQVQTTLTMRVQLDLRADLFQQIQRLSLSYHQKRKSGDILNRLGVQAASISQVALAILPLTQSFITLIGMFWVAYLLDAELALLSLIVVPFLYWSIGYYTRRIEPDVCKVRSKEAGAFSIVNEVLTMFPVTLAFGREQHEYDRYRMQTEEALEARLRLTRRQTRFAFAVNLTAAVGTSLVMAVGVVHVLSGELTVGLLLVIITYIGSVYTPLQAISSAVGSLQEKMVDLRMALELLETEPEICDPPDALEISNCRGHLRFEEVCFSYDGRGQVLSEVSFEVKSGQLVALVGPTGAGKTSLISLLPKFYVPQEGRILLDGVDLSRIGLKSLRRMISLVTQEPLLSSGSIAENILYGKPEATREEVEAAARAAQIDEFIRTLPEGYETLTGECSKRLSAGERQRITLARAFLRDAPLLILDEPTSCLDASTERNILSALWNLIEGRTTLMVAHRLSTIRSADLILVMNEGRIVESGSHDNLLAAEAYYSGLWRDHHRTSELELTFEEG